MFSLFAAATKMWPSMYYFCEHVNAKVLFGFLIPINKNIKKIMWIEGEFNICLWINH